MVAPTPSPTRAVRRGFRPIDIWKRYLPPVRLVWLFLGVITWYGGGFVNSKQSFPLIVLPIAGVLTDLLFQRARFPRLRFPDAAIANGLFLSLIIWPAIVTLPLLCVGVLTVAIRHLARAGGHPWLNPAAAGIAIGALAFGLPTSWHVGIDTNGEILAAALGAVLILRARHTWRFPVYFFAAYVPLVLAIAFAYGAGSSWSLILWTGALGPQAVFYAMFMVSEPRTAPSSRPAMAAFSVLVGVMSAAFPLFFTIYPSLGSFGVIAPFLALFVGNLFTIVLPGARGGKVPRPAPAKGVAGPASLPARPRPIPAPGLAASSERAHPGRSVAGYVKLIR